MGDPTSSLIFSIDVGVVNIRVAFYEANGQDMVFADKVSLAPSMKAMKDEAEIIPRVFKLFFHQESPLKAMIEQARVVIVEQQKKRKMLLIQHVIGALCFRSNFAYEFVSPRSVKAHFNTVKFSCKKSGKSVKGAKKNHAANKRAAVEKAHSLFPKFMSRVSAAKRDDVAATFNLELGLYRFEATKLLYTSTASHSVTLAAIVKSDVIRHVM
ncbi:Hypothetical Protein FCC1311_094512 [Hondaea fermentalgiana]|uniref:Uncharacterized protein n=1 Tax=Hondaea fermentalgiana TaxID=2315210 RepID=A0A2R5GQS4_9STRA|nr:Hypothetical Protein FCC1311_094512 [Hondaea fermentalgiana]|eukprot:GBG33227.1 Hypothetical Protein FCC1311_094512 [Hondaea fermentalgiana]